MPNRVFKTRRGARAEAAQPAQFFRELVENLPHIAWTARADGSAEYFNARASGFTGRTLKQLEGWGWRSIVHPDDWERCLARWTKAFKTGVPYEVEYRLRRHDGRYLWHLGAAMPVREGARIARWVGSCTEIENQKRAERLLEKARHSLESMVSARAEQQGQDASHIREAIESAAQRERGSQQERFRRFLDMVPAIAWIKDSKFRYQWLSASYSRLHGKLLDDVRGRDDFEIWPGELAQLFRKDDELALRANGPVQFVERAPFVDGSIARWLVVKFPLPDEGGGLGVAGIGFDITEDVSAPGDGGDAVIQDPLGGLSARERQVMQMVVEGHTSAEAGLRLGLSPKSIDTYRSRLMAKLGIDDLPTLVKFALRHGLTGKR